MIGAAPGHGPALSRGRAFAVALARADALTLIPAQSYPSRMVLVRFEKGVWPMAGAVRTVESRCLARPGLSLGKSQLRQVIDPAVAAVFEVDRAPAAGLDAGLDA